MKKTLLSLAITSCFFATTAYSAESSLETVNQKASYTLGTDLAQNFLDQGLNIDIKALTAGMNDVINNHPLQLTEAEMRASVLDFQKKMQAKQVEDFKALAEKNAKLSAAFLAENKLKPGVKTLDSGLQYRIITEGKGDHPSVDDYLTAHYKGALIDGTVFDSSFTRGTPIEFQMNDVIPGWKEALKIMRAGSKWEIYIPPALAYGETGAGGSIGPNEVLIFTLELIKIDSKKPSGG